MHSSMIYKADKTAAKRQQFDFDCSLPFWVLVGSHLLVDGIRVSLAALRSVFIYELAPPVSALAFEGLCDREKTRGGPPGRSTDRNCGGSK